MYINMWIIIPLYILVAIMFCVIGYGFGRQQEAKNTRTMLQPYYSRDIGLVPRVLTDKSGKEYNGCNACGKKVWKPMQFCPYCAQRINWNFIRIKNTNFDAT